MKKVYKIHRHKQDIQYDLYCGYNFTLHISPPMRFVKPHFRYVLSTDCRAVLSVGYSVGSLRGLLVDSAISVRKPRAHISEKFFRFLLGEGKGNAVNIFVERGRHDGSIFFRKIF